MGESQGQEGGVSGPRVVMVMVGAVGQRGTLSPLSPCVRETAGSVCLAWPALLRLSLALSVPEAASH